MPVAVSTFRTLSEAARAFESDRAARIYSGGTIVMRDVNEGDVSFNRLIRITDPAYRAVSVGSEIRLGGGVTMGEIAAQRDLAFLAPVARAVGGPQVRTVATVAGNLFAPRPYGEMAAALVALGAVAETAEGRRLPVEELVRGAPRALVAAVLFPRPSGDFRFAKVTRVRPKGAALMSIAALLPRGGSGETRIVFNGMGPHPVRAVAAERALGGRASDPSAIAAAARAAAEGLSPPDDALASAWYRREVAGVHLKRLLESR